MALRTILAGLATTGLLCSAAWAGGHHAGRQAAWLSGHGRSAFSFALIGDGPYGDAAQPSFDRLIEDINRDRDVKFVVHIGDIKSGGTECSDERLVRRFEQLQQIRTALVYTPGDNEWTDCHRTAAGGYNPLERLAFIRDLFFHDPDRTTGQRPLRVLSQSSVPGYETYVENTLFVMNGVVFSQVHVIGSHNDLSPWSGIDPSDSTSNPRSDRLAEYEGRNSANVAWLGETFRIAAKIRAAGVVVSMQADPRLDLASADPGRAGFDDFLDRLFTLSNDFGRPVVLAHGDSHIFRVDTPRLRPANPEPGIVVPRLTRVETFGEGDEHWVEIRVDPRSREVFSYRPRLVEENL